MTDPVARFQDIFNRLSKDTICLVDELYAKEIHFADPIHEVHGIEHLREYFRRLYDGVVLCQFDFGEPVVGENRAAIPWVMHLEHGRFRPGQRVAVPGMSDIRFGEKLTYHRDYFDVGKLIYERVPLLGGIVRGIKAKL